MIRNLVSEVEFWNPNTNFEIVIPTTMNDNSFTRRKVRILTYMIYLYQK